MTAEPSYQDVRTEIPRHRTWNGPLVMPENHRCVPGTRVCPKCGRSWKGKCACTYYKRCTTYIDVIADNYALKAWDRRLVAYGMSQRPDLVLAASACKAPAMGEVELTREDKEQLQSIADQAKDVAKGRAAATVGTSLHKLTERMDMGEELGYVPEPWPADLRAYEQARDASGVEYVDIESFRVHDELKVGGTTDRIGWIGGRLRVLDVKGLALTTPLPTPTGWTTMAAVQVGDQVLGSDGKPCNVIIKSEPKRIGTYVVSFDDGTAVVCDSEHIWWTTTRYDRDTNRGPQARSIQEIIETLTLVGGQNQHCVPVPAPLELPEVELPIDPYLLGCWLGDGQHDRNVITKGDDLFDVLRSDGHVLGVRQVDKRTDQCVAHSVKGLAQKLKASNLFGNKHVPDVYLRASRHQRLRLLQGLMDTDGTWNTARRRASFTTTDKAMALQVEELLLTLGQRPHFASVQRTGFGKTVTAYDVEFLPVGMQPFRLPRKMAKATAQKPVNTTRAGRRVIVNVEPGPDVETACIGVDSNDHVYLCSEHFIPTHNTGSIWWEGGPAMQLALYARSIKYDIATDTRIPDAAQIDLNVAYVIHLPQGQGTCRFIPVNIMKGWMACLTAQKVWAAREQKDYFMDPKDVVDGPTYEDLAVRADSVVECRRIWKNAHDQCCLSERLKNVLRRRVEELEQGGL